MSGNKAPPGWRGWHATGQLVSAWPAPPSPVICAHSVVRSTTVLMCYAPPFAPGTAKVVTVHDLIPNRLPGPAPQGLESAFEPIRNLWFRMPVRQRPSRHHGERFLAPELLEFLPLPQAKVHRHIQRVQPSKATLTAADVRRRFGLQA